MGGAWTMDACRTAWRPVAHTLWRDDARDCTSRPAAFHRSAVGIQVWGRSARCAHSTHAHNRESAWHNYLRFYLKSLIECKSRGAVHHARGAATREDGPRRAARARAARAAGRPVRGHRAGARRARPGACYRRAYLYAVTVLFAESVCSSGLSCSGTRCAGHQWCGAPIQCSRVCGVPVCARAPLRVLMPLWVGVGWPARSTQSWAHSSTWPAGCCRLPRKPVLRKVMLIRSAVPWHNAACRKSNRDMPVIT